MVVGLLIGAPLGIGLGVLRFPKGVLPTLGDTPITLGFFACLYNVGLATSARGSVCIYLIK